MDADISTDCKITSNIGKIKEFPVKIIWQMDTNLGVGSGLQFKSKDIVYQGFYKSYYLLKNVDAECYNPGTGQKSVLKYFN